MTGILVVGAADSAIDVVASTVDITWKDVELSLSVTDCLVVSSVLNEDSSGETVIGILVVGATDSSGETEVVTDNCSAVVGSLSANFN